MTEVPWERYPLLAQTPPAQTWLQIQHNLGLAPNTIAAYGRALNDYLSFCHGHQIVAEAATKEHLSQYVHDLTSRPNPRGERVRVLDSGAGLANATLQQRLTAIRLFYDYLVEEGQRLSNPVGRGRYTTGKGFGGKREKGLIPRYTKLPWIPNEEQWQAILEVAQQAPIRDRLMLALAYDAGLRREELCALRTDDFDPAHRTLRIRAETTKGRRERIVAYSASTGILLQHYLVHRQTISHARGALFLSESDRNFSQPITIWTWSKVVKRIADQASVRQFSTHTLRHLCLTDLARSGWELHAIATFAGHRSLSTTLQYIHLSGRDLANKLASAMAQIHSWRAQMLASGNVQKGDAP
jgi:integrase/recombinase XerD